MPLCGYITLGLNGTSWRREAYRPAQRTHNGCNAADRSANAAKSVEIGVLELERVELQRQSADRRQCAAEPVLDAL